SPGAVEEDAQPDARILCRSEALHLIVADAHPLAAVLDLTGVGVSGAGARERMQDLVEARAHRQANLPGDPRLRQPAEPALARGGALVLERPGLAAETGAVAAKRTIGSDDAVARDDERHRVHRVGAPHRARRSPPPQRRGDLGVAPRLADRDAP